MHNPRKLDVLLLSCPVKGQGIVPLWKDEVVVLVGTPQAGTAVLRLRVLGRVLNLDEMTVSGPNRLCGRALYEVTGASCDENAGADMLPNFMLDSRLAQRAIELSIVIGKKALVRRPDSADVNNYAIRHREPRG